MSGYTSKSKKIGNFGSRTGLTRDEDIRDQDTILSPEEISKLTEAQRKKYEEKTGKKGKKYTHKPKKELSDMNKYIDEHNARLKKKKDKKGSGWFSGLFNKDDK